MRDIQAGAAALNMRLTMRFFRPILGALGAIARSEVLSAPTRGVR